MRYPTQLIAIPIAVVAYGVGAILMVTAAAYAQEVVDTTVTAEPWVVTFMPFLQVLVTGFIGLLTTFLGLYMKAKYDIDWEKENRDAFQTSATNAAGLLIKEVGAEAAMTKIDVHSPVLKKFIDYVGKGAPKAIAQWGITPERVATTILSKVAQVLPVEGQPTPISDPVGRSTLPGKDYTVRSPWFLSAAVLLVACTQIHTQLVELTGDEAKATCLEVASMDAVQQSSPLGIELFLRLAQSGIACFLLPTTPGIPSEVVALPATAPAPPQAQEIVPPPEVQAMIADEI